MICTSAYSWSDLLDLTWSFNAICNTVPRWTFNCLFSKPRKTLSRVHRTSGNSSCKPNCEHLYSELRRVLQNTHLFPRSSRLALYWALEQLNWSENKRKHWFAVCSKKLKLKRTLFSSLCLLKRQLLLKYRCQFYGAGVQNNLGSSSLAAYSYIKTATRFSNSCAGNACATKIHSLKPHTSNFHTEKLITHQHKLSQETRMSYQSVLEVFSNYRPQDQRILTFLIMERG